MKRNIDLKVKIIKAGLTQRELAHRTGIHEVNVSKALNGRLNLTEAELAKINTALEGQHAKELKQ